MEPFIFLIKLQAQTIASAFAIQLAMALYCPLGGMGEGPQKPGFIFKPQTAIAFIGNQLVRYQPHSNMILRSGFIEIKENAKYNEVKEQSQQTESI